MEKLKKVLIFENITVKEAFKKMDISAEKILIIANKSLQLKGVITDGDIRRWILKGGKLTDKIFKIMNKKPLVIFEGYTNKEVRQIMMKNKIECVPVINKSNKLIFALWWFDVFQEHKNTSYGKINAPVVIMAGGQGTRLHPFTKILPKPLIPIQDKPIIEIIMNKFCEMGSNDFYLSVNFKANMIKAYFNDFDHNYKICYLEEKKPLGTAGSLYLLKDKIKKTFFVHNCDIIIEADYADILKFHKTNKNKITIIASLKHYLIPYGIIEMNKGGCLKNIKEKPEFDFFVNTGMYVLEPDVLQDIPKASFFLMTELINQYLKKEKKIGVYPVSDKSWIDIGQWEELQSVLEKIENR